MKTFWLWVQSFRCWKDKKKLCIYYYIYIYMHLYIFIIKCRAWSHFLVNFFDGIIVFWLDTVVLLFTKFLVWFLFQLVFWSPKLEGDIESSSSQMNFGVLFWIVHSVCFICFFVSYFSMASLWQLQIGFQVSVDRWFKHGGKRRDEFRS